MSRKWFAVGISGGLFLLWIGILTYGFSLRLPFFLDDMVHFRWLEWNGISGIWSSARLLGYYRPLPFTIWKMIFAYNRGGYDPIVSHALNVALHLLNTVLVFGLVASRRVHGRLALGFATALLFLLFPFSYQAVPWVGSLTHPLVTSLILGALLCYRFGSRRNSRWLRGISVALALIAPFAHETGVLIAPLLALLLLTDEKAMPVRDVLRRTWPYWVCAALGLAIWVLVPKEVKQVGLLDMLSRWQNGVYFAQGLAYPAAPLATRLLRASGRLTDLQATFLVAVPVILAWSAALWKAGRGRLLALALGWFGLCVAPAWLMLPFSYVIDGPRLLYAASIGAAIFWAIPLSVRWRRGWTRVVGTALAVLVVMVAGLGGYRFIRARVPLYEEMRLSVDQLVEAVQAVPASEGILCVNCPSWLAPLESTYPVGHEGVTLVPAYSSIGDLLWLHTGEERTIRGAVVPDLLSHWRFHYSCVGSAETLDSVQPLLRESRNILRADYAASHISIHSAGGLQAENQQPAPAFLASFDSKVALVSAFWERQESLIEVALVWQSWESLGQEATVFMHLYNEAGQVVSQADGYPVGNLSRPALWRPGDQWRDVRLLRLPDNPAPGRYTIKAGLYPISGGPRLSASDPAGQRLPDDAATIAVIEVR